MKKVYKFGTGQPIPEGAIYLNTQVEEIQGRIDMSNAKNSHSFQRLVWHYFLVEVQE